MDFTKEVNKWRTNDRDFTTVVNVLPSGISCSYVYITVLNANSMETGLSCIQKNYIPVEGTKGLKLLRVDWKWDGPFHCQAVPCFKGLLAATPELDSGRMDDNQLNNKHTWMFANTQPPLLLLSGGRLNFELAERKKNPKIKPPTGWCN